MDYQCSSVSGQCEIEPLEGVSRVGLWRLLLLLGPCKDEFEVVEGDANTVAGSMISSELEMFGVGRQCLNTDGGSTFPGSTVASRMIFGYDPTLEDAFRTPGHGASNSRLNNGEGSSFQRLVVMAPAEKLGVVIDNPTGHLRIVHVFKETSVLHGRVNIGNLSISMDEIDCLGFSAMQESRLISSCSNNPARMLVLLRGGY